MHCSQGPVGSLAAEHASAEKLAVPADDLGAVAGRLAAVVEKLAVVADNLADCSLPSNNWVAGKSTSGCLAGCMLALYLEIAAGSRRCNDFQ